MTLHYMMAGTGSLSISGDTITPKDGHLIVAGNIRPDGDGTRNLGGSTLDWNIVYQRSGYFDGDSIVTRANANEVAIASGDTLLATITANVRGTPQEGDLKYVGNPTWQIQAYLNGAWVAL